MKKVTRFISISLILIGGINVFSSCDFLRRVAGRPTSEDLTLMSHLQQMKEQMRLDSLRRSEDSIRIAQELIARQQRADSLTAARRLDSMGTKLSPVFRFGVPENDIPGKFNAIIGVFRTDEMAVQVLSRARGNGFDPLIFNFPSGEKAVCLISSDELSEVEEVIREGRSTRDCPKDAWIYVKR